MRVGMFFLPLDLVSKLLEFSHLKIRRYLSGKMQDAAPNVAIRYRCLALVCLLACLIFHIITLDRQSLFVDEVAELNSAHNTWQWTIWRTDSMPPLYPILLKAWIMIWSSDGSGRWLSVLCSMLAAVVAWRYSSEGLGHRVGLWVLLLMLVNPLNIFYAQWTRGYALMLMWATLSICTFLSGCRSGKRGDWVWFTISTVCGVYTHYYFVMVTWSLLLGWMLQRRSAQWKWVVGSLVVAAILCGPVIIFLKADFEYQKAIRAPRPLSISAVAYTYLSLFSGFAMGPSAGELHALSATQAIRQTVPTGMVLLLSTIPLFARGIRTLWQRELVPVLLTLFVLPLTLIGLLGALSGITYNVRFVCWLTLPLSICLAAGICHTNAHQSARDKSDIDRVQPSRFRRNWLYESLSWRTWASGIAIGFMVLANCNRLIFDKYQFEDLRSAAAFIQADATPNEPVFVVSDYMVEPLRYYLDGRPRAIELPTVGVWSVVFHEDQTVEQGVQSINQHASGRFWLVYSREYHGDPQGKFLHQLTQRFELTKVAHYAGVQVYTGQTSSAPTNTQ